MKTVNRTSVEVLGCSRQEQIEVAGIGYWRWLAPGCPFGKVDIDAICTNCRLYVVKQPAAPEDSAPIDSGLPLAV